MDDFTLPPNGADLEPLRQAVPDGVWERLDEAAQDVGGPWRPPAAYEGAVGRTMFDTPRSDDNTVTVLIPREAMEALPAQSLVRIVSVPDGREYLGVVVAGPFAEPDGMRGDAPIVVTTTVKGAVFIPQFHGRVEVEIMGERVDGVLVPHRLRPLPNSPVFALSAEETSQILKVNGAIRFGMAIGHEDLPVCVPADTKMVLPRHWAVLGTTGGGKSTTVSGLIAQFQKQGIATVLVDTEGEYTSIGQPTEDQAMIRALHRRDLQPHGVKNVRVYQPAALSPKPGRIQFTLQFADLSPHMVCEILDLSDAQQMRYFQAYDIAKRLVRRSHGALPPAEEPDEMERGYPNLTLAHMVDVIRACTAAVARDETDISFITEDARTFSGELRGMVAEAKLEHLSSWRALQGRVGRLHRVHLFDHSKAQPLDYRTLIRPGHVAILDLSETDSPQLNNMVIAEVLRGVYLAQNEAYKLAEEQGTPPPRTMMVIEEAHEFLAAERIKKMEALFAQVARISRRGRKRWLGLVFVTQLPQHLPDEVLGLVNNYVLHKIADAGVISTLKRSIGGIDEGLWHRLPALAPGQAIVHATSMARPLLVAIDPTPCKLLLVE